MTQLARIRSRCTVVSPQAPLRNRRSWAPVAEDRRNLEVDRGRPTTSLRTKSALHPKRRTREDIAHRSENYR